MDMDGERLAGTLATNNEFGAVDTLIKTQVGLVRPVRLACQIISYCAIAKARNIWDYPGFAASQTQSMEKLI
ncbi:hypothetical protein [Kiritimatiella glycovorans]|uniref:hypothetical protein n=1 Tax=Kiritimatiella glycovorans TaxID=1307763 RepID=UPI0011876922|nr:hypothetical protein [Kiritimatiella glycovorans]